MGTVARGYLFTHPRMLDVSWQPGPGQKWADAPHAVCEVTRVAGGRVWFRYAGEGGRFVASLADVVAAEPA